MEVEIAAGKIEPCEFSSKLKLLSYDGAPLKVGAVYYQTRLISYSEPCPKTTLKLALLIVMDSSWYLFIYDNSHNIWFKQKQNTGVDEVMKVQNQGHNL
jgi:hypothetical protein